MSSALRPLQPPDAEQRALLGWAEEHRRDLPWRHSLDPWAVLVSEVMLQQTQVDRVIPRWTAFLSRWPTTAAMSATTLADVLVEWQGLGYPRRAKALHAAATQIEDTHGGVFPDRLDALLALSGIGPYTARAVLAFAFERDVAVVDTNVGRILARRAGRTLSAKDAQRMADEWLAQGHGWAWNQGVLDLGASMCRPRSPRCEECPVQPWCEWGSTDRAGDDPATGSAAVSRRQAPFEGSARQARGRVLAALGAGPIDPATLDEPQLLAVDSLIEDGLVERTPAGRVVFAGG